MSHGIPPANEEELILLKCQEELTLGLLNFTKTTKVRGLVMFPRSPLGLAGKITIITSEGRLCASFSRKYLRTGSELRSGVITQRPSPEGRFAGNLELFRSGQEQAFDTFYFLCQITSNRVTL